MREIKFRAWDGKKMHYNEETWIRESDNYWWYGIPGHDTPPDKAFSGNEGTAIMQYTGLKDKNGKEIYEGDIITNGKGCPYCEVKNKTVEFEEFIYFSFEYNGIFDDCEVIGNKFENSELLKLK